MKHQLLFTLISAIILFCNNASLAKEKRKEYCIAFYNLENLFDTIHADHKNDYEFLPDGKRQWNKEKYEQKLKNMSRAILAINDWRGPDVLGVCEIENRQVLEDLISRTNLKNFNYGIIHSESRDRRGIDVALLYKKDRVRILGFRNLRIENNVTRDILYVKSLLKKDTVSYFVNHWPSRWGGSEKSESKRMDAAALLKSCIDTLKDENVIIMGDFNDTPQDRSLSEVAQFQCAYVEGEYYNTSCHAQGTLKHQARWQVFDQIIVSSEVVAPADIRLLDMQQNTVVKDWLLIDDDKYAGDKPFRTYYRGQFINGFSDHLPVKIMIRR